MDQLSDILSNKFPNTPVTPLAPAEPTEEEQPTTIPTDILDDPFPVEPETLTPPVFTPAEEAITSDDTPIEEPTITPALEDTTTEHASTAQTLDVTALKSQIYSIKEQLDSMLRILEGQAHAQTLSPRPAQSKILDSGEQIIEGSFDGESMVGPDGQTYPVPPNYASKSKIVEGDRMKLTITATGRFIYKQIGPVPRKPIVGELSMNEQGNWVVIVDHKPYRILTASVTFYKGQAGDSVTILVPKDREVIWGAVDNIIHQ